MSVDVPKRLIPPVDSSTVRQIYGKENPDIIKPVLSQGNISQAALNSRTANEAAGSVRRQAAYSGQRTGSIQGVNSGQRAGSVQGMNSVQRAGSVQGVNSGQRTGSVQMQNSFPTGGRMETPVRTTGIQPAGAGSAPRNAVPVQNQAAAPVQPRSTAPKRRRAAASGQALIKGQKWTVAGAGGSAIHKMRVCVGWEENGRGCELDMSAFMLAQNEKVLSDEWFVFYGQEQSPDGSVKYRSNSENFSLPDDAELSVSLDDVYPNVQKILVCVTIYEASERHHNFGMVRDLYARILDDRGQELVRYRADKLPPEAMALVLGELYRYKDAWKFNAVGSGYNRDLSEFCRIYGVELE